MDVPLHLSAEELARNLRKLYVAVLRREEEESEEESEEEGEEEEEETEEESEDEDCSAFNLGGPEWLQEQLENPTWAYEMLQYWEECCSASLQGIDMEIYAKMRDVLA